MFHTARRARESAKRADCSLSYIRNVGRATTPLGFVTEMTGDAVGRVRVVKTPVDSLQQSFRTQTTTYDVMDRPELVVDVGLSLKTTYDPEGLPITVRRWSTPDPAKVDTLKDSLVYDPAGRTTSAGLLVFQASREACERHAGDDGAAANRRRT